MAVVLRRHAERFRRMYSIYSFRVCSATDHPRRSFIISALYPIDFLRHAFHRAIVSHSHFGASTRELCFSTLHISPLRSLLSVDFNGLRDQRDENVEAGVGKLIGTVRKAVELPTEIEAIAFLDESGIEPNANLVILAVWELRNCWESAMLVFKWSQKWGFNNDRLLGLIVWVLGASGKFNIAWCLVRDAHRSLAVNIRLPMLVMIERYAAMNLPEKAIKTFKVMENLRLSVDHNAFYTLLHALCENGNAVEAEEIMFKNKKLFPLETDGFNILLNAWCNVSVDIMEARRVWREMSKNCITPDEVSYTYMVSCYSNVKDLFNSLRLYDEMKRRGWHPSLEVYNSLIYVLTSDNCLKEALKVLNKVKEMNLRPDSESYNSLIGPLCTAKRFDEARVILTGMVRENISPNKKTYHAFLNGSNFENTLEVLNQIKQAGLRPDRDTFILIFDNFFGLGQPENALKIWVDMKDYGVEPESAHYVKIIHNLVKCGCLAKARELYAEMISTGFQVEPKLKRLVEDPPRRKAHKRKWPLTIVRHVNKDIRMNKGERCIRRKRGGKRKSRKVPINMGIHS